MVINILSRRIYIHVPALLLIKENYRCIQGMVLLSFIILKLNDANNIATQGNGEPMGFSLGSTKDIRSELFTFYNATPEDLSAKRYWWKSTFASLCSSKWIWIITNPPRNI